MNSYIPYGKQWVEEEDIKAVCEVLRSNWLTTGPLVSEFEKRIAGKTGANYCVVFNSGTAALHAAYHAAGIKPDDEVITTPITFTATANAALYLGAKPIFVDIGSNSFHIDFNEIENAITIRTRAIVPVDMAGIPAALDEIMDIAGRHNLIVIEDAAHALGATYKDSLVGSISDLTVFSFHPVKHITTGEGGAVTTNSKDYYNKLLSFRNHGIVRDKSLFTNISSDDELSGSWYYEQQELGYNYRLPDINCALGLSQLKKLEQFINRRRSIAARYNKGFKNNPKLILPPESLGENTLKEAAWHLYILQLAGSSPKRSVVLDRLREQGIGTQLHYIPVYLHPYYKKLGYKPGLCPRAEGYYRRAFTIPLYPAMTDEEVARVVRVINSSIQ